MGDRGEVCSSVGRGAVLTDALACCCCVRRQPMARRARRAKLGRMRMEAGRWRTWRSHLRCASGMPRCMPCVRACMCARVLVCVCPCSGVSARAPSASACVCMSWEHLLSVCAPMHPACASVFCYRRCGAVRSVGCLAVCARVHVCAHECVLCLCVRVCLRLWVVPQDCF